MLSNRKGVFGLVRIFRPRLGRKLGIQQSRRQKHTVLCVHFISVAKLGLFVPAILYGILFRRGRVGEVVATGWGLPSLAACLSVSESIGAAGDLLRPLSKLPQLQDLFSDQPRQKKIEHNSIPPSLLRLLSTQADSPTTVATSFSRLDAFQPEDVLDLLGSNDTLPSSPIFLRTVISSSQVPPCSLNLQQTHFSEAHLSLVAKKRIFTSPLERDAHAHSSSAAGAIAFPSLD